MRVSNKFNAEIVYYKSKDDWAPCVSPQAWRKLAFVIPGPAEASAQLLVGY